MSPRERAEALGWRKTDFGAWMDRDGRCLLLHFHGAWLMRGAYLLESTRGHWRHTEDEALEHALLLLDVWLS